MSRLKCEFGSVDMIKPSNILLKVPRRYFIGFLFVIYFSRLYLFTCCLVSSLQPSDQQLGKPRILSQFPNSFN